MEFWRSSRWGVTDIPALHFDYSAVDGYKEVYERYSDIERARVQATQTTRSNFSAYRVRPQLGGWCQREQIELGDTEGQDRLHRAPSHQKVRRLLGLCPAELPCGPRLPGRYRCQRSAWNPQAGRSVERGSQCRIRSASRFGDLPRSRPSVQETNIVPQES